MKQHSPQFLRRRKFLIILPALTLPFIAFAFWAMDGGKDPRHTQRPAELSGLNTDLPVAHLDEKALDKLGFYKKAESDSNRLKELIKNDPNYSSKELFTAGDEDLSFREIMSPHSYGRVPFAGPEEEKISDKLHQLQMIVNKGGALQAHDKREEDGQQMENQEPALHKEDLDRLDQMMQHMNSRDSVADPEMVEINKMLEKILEIQHPERLVSSQEKVPDRGKKQVSQLAIPAKLPGRDLVVQQEENILFNKKKPPAPVRAAFPEVRMPEAIPAVVPETSTLVSGATLKLRLPHELFIDHVCIPKNTFLYGKAILNEDRLKITIHSIRYKDYLVDVQLKVYDLDGIEGIYIPGSLSKEVIRRSAMTALQGINDTYPDPSFEGRALNAGVGAGKDFLNRRSRPVKVTVKAGYRVLLKNAQESAPLSLQRSPED